ncbi:hypothetical protein K456DRAFT_1699878 [Colletotrichum gloeosporioides 23]|nr:hypothetical protein K456DRAFT_1699878 [Colletotrichum gloeosporioides 23]
MAIPTHISILGQCDEVRAASGNGGSVRRDGSGAGRQRGCCEPAQGAAGGCTERRMSPAAHPPAAALHEIRRRPAQTLEEGWRGDGGGGADDNATRPAKSRSDSGIAPPISSNSPDMIRRTFSHYRHKCISLSYQACGMRALRGNRSQNGMMGE